MKKILIIAIITLAAVVLYKSLGEKPSDKNTILLKSDVKWEQLNPARGDKSPQAANLWGIRNEDGPSGFLLKPIDGFRSPPHIHNIAYRGVVISGLLHNDDPKAVDMWMPQGSFWTQPAGEVHITAAKGDNVLAYIEVEDNFGVHPEHEAFHNHERPVNVDESNIVWLSSDEIKWVKEDNAEVAFLWEGANNLRGSLLKLPKNYKAKIKVNADNFHAIIIKGNPKISSQELTEGSYFGSEGKANHTVISGAAEETIIYIRTDGKFKID